MGIIAGLISMVAWGTGDFLAAISSRKVGNVRTLFWMYATSFVITSVLFFFQLPTFTLQSVLPYGLLLFAVAAFQVLANMSFYKGLEIGTVSVVSPIGASFAVVTVILSLIFFQEQLTSLQATAIILVFLGVFWFLPISKSW
ncbi:MAG TPA: DMT family transporter [Patescibacteria group bacterium]|nr:DMT family transporter [Patescibacteria group bacterium]